MDIYILINKTKTKQQKFDFSLSLMKKFIVKESMCQKPQIQLPYSVYICCN